MTIYEKTEIDIDSIRKNVKAAFPAGRDRKQLMKLYDLFESGEWTKAAKYSRKWGDAEGEEWNLREAIDESVFNALFNHCCGKVYLTGVMRAVGDEYIDSLENIY